MRNDPFRLAFCAVELARELRTRVNYAAHTQRLTNPHIF